MNELIAALKNAEARQYDRPLSGAADAKIRARLLRKRSSVVWLPAAVSVACLVLLLSLRAFGGGRPAVPRVAVIPAEDGGGLIGDRGLDAALAADPVFPSPDQVGGPKYLP